MRIVTSDSGSHTLSDWRAVTSLSLGDDLVDADSLDWGRVFVLATNQRCAPLAWLRNGALIRAHAPPAVVAQWRLSAFAASEHARDRASHLAALLHSFAGLGIEAVVLKGLPLSVKLYGEPWARPLSDTDLYVSLEQRATAHQLLVANGWTHLYGDLTREGTYRRDEVAGPHFLEVHSSLVDENLLTHVSLDAPQAEEVPVAGRSMLAHDGALLPIFLAIHLAKHPHVPLLWWIDFLTVRRAFGEQRWSEVRTLAGRHKLDRFLEWAIAASDDLPRIASSDDADALAALTRLRRRHARSQVARLVTLTVPLRDRFRICAAWVFPYAQRRTPLTLARRTLRRCVEWRARRGGPFRHASAL